MTRVQNDQGAEGPGFRMTRVQNDQGAEGQGSE
jgi:hypothetical protein